MIQRQTNRQRGQISRTELPSFGICAVEGNRSRICDTLVDTVQWGQIVGVLQGRRVHLRCLVYRVEKEISEKANWSFSQLSVYFLLLLILIQLCLHHSSSVDGGWTE